MRRIAHAVVQILINFSSNQDVRINANMLGEYMMMYRHLMYKDLSACGVGILQWT